MATKRLIFIVSISISLLFYACPLKECIGTTHSIIIEHNFIPAKKNLSVGDTLWMESTTPCDKILNTENQEIINLCDVKSVGTSMGIVRLEKNNDGFPTFAVADFSYVSNLGKIYTDDKVRPEDTKQISFLIAPNKYQLRIGFICKRKGKYLFSVDTGGIVPNKNKDCIKIASTFISGNGDQHLELYKEFWNVTTLSDYDTLHSYCFEVQ